MATQWPHQQECGRDCRTSQGLLERMSMERLPRTGTAVSLGLRTPRKRVRVSLSCPVTLSTSVLSSRPFSRPASGSSFQTEHRIPQFLTRVAERK